MRSSRNSILSESRVIVRISIAKRLFRPIAPSNKGHAMMKAMGWKEGQGIGKTTVGIAEPIAIAVSV